MQQGFERVRRAHTANPFSDGPGAHFHSPKVKDAMGYLEKVKTKFAKQPTVYNKFLDIMKDFKSQAYVRVQRASAFAGRMGRGRGSPSSPRLALYFL